MEKNMDNKLFELLKKDSTGGPTVEIEERLMYTFMLKNGTSNVRQNSFSGFSSWLFSFKNIGVKTAVLSCLLLFTLMNSNLHQNQSFQGTCDSTYVEKALVLDSACFTNNKLSDKKDTLF